MTDVLENEDFVVEQLLVIRQGILDGDWNNICEGYNNITGEELTPPENTIQSKNKLNAIRSKLAEKTKPKNSEDDISEVSETENSGFKIISMPFNEEASKKNEVVYKEAKKAKDSIKRENRGKKLDAMKRENNKDGAIRVYDEDPRNS